jgi:hypothetical protein
MSRRLSFFCWVSILLLAKENHHIFVFLFLPVLKAIYYIALFMELRDTVAIAEPDLGTMSSCGMMYHY